jgi:hypothetical protein
MLFEICIGIFYNLRNWKYLKKLEELVLVTPSGGSSNQVSTIFYYMDLFYFFPEVRSETVERMFKKSILENYENNIFMAGKSANIYFSTYYFLTKILVYINRINEYHAENKGTNTLTQFLERIAKIIIEDISVLRKHTQALSSSSTTNKDLRIKIQDYLYNELKKILELQEDKDYQSIKEQFDKSIKEREGEIKRYYKYKNDKDDMDLSINRTGSKSSTKKSLIAITCTTPLDSFRKNSISSKATTGTNIISLVHKESYNIGSHESKKSVMSNLSGQKYHFESPKASGKSLNTIPTRSNKNSFISYKTTKSKFSEIISEADLYEDTLENHCIQRSNCQNFMHLDINSAKKDLLLSTFAIFMKESYSKNQNFLTMREQYNQLCKRENLKYSEFGDKIKNDKENNFDSSILKSETEMNLKYNYPIKVKNMFGSNYQRLFVKHDLKFYENKLLPYSHSYLFTGSEERVEPQMDYNLNNNLIKLIKEGIFICPCKTLLRSYDCELIGLDGVIYGVINVYSDFLIFKSVFDKNYNPEEGPKYNSIVLQMFSSLNEEIIFKEKEFKIYFDEIREIIIRRFLYMWQGNEIILKNGKSYYFNLMTKFSNTNFLDYIREVNEKEKYKISIITDSKKEFKKRNYVKKWMEGQISNFDYLLILNKFSSRSFHDMNQYPVFPWIIANYGKLDDKTLYRNLSFPISVQTPEKRLQAVKKYEEEKEEKFKVHFRTHYSTSAIVCYYTARLNPFTYNLIKLQGLKFDIPSRMFMSLKETYEILERQNDNRELTPELFFQPEILMNSNCNYFGIRPSDHQRVDSLNLPEWANDPIDFIYKHRLFMENRNVSSTINHWIDNIFGCNQLVKNKDSINVFSKTSYEQEIKLEDKEKKYNGEELVSKIRNKIHYILNFGQTPHKLFEDKHPKKHLDVTKIKSDEFMELRDLLYQKQKIEIEKIKKGVRFFNFSQSYFYVLNGENEIEVFEKQFFKRKNKIRLKHYLNLNHTHMNVYKQMKEKCLVNIYKSKYAVIDLQDCKFFISCRHLDLSFKIYSGENLLKEVLCQSFITCLEKSKNDTKLYIGQANGMIIVWNMFFDLKTPNIKLQILKKFIAHELSVNCILINEKLNILISGGDDGYVYVRNLYDLEILTCIQPNIHTNSYQINIVDLRVSEFDFLYVTSVMKDRHVLFAYTLNGLLFSYLEGYFAGIDFTRSGKLILGHLNGKVQLIDPCNLKNVFL